MDYCHPCRRHLNGALACPGCGTPAHELPSADDRLTASENPGPRFGTEAAAVDTLPRDPGERLDEEPDEEPDEGAGDAAPGARSSRRDRKAAAHRRRRRRTLLVAAGFVLAAGGLSLVELGMDAPHSPDKPAAASGETTDGEATREVGEASAVPADAPSGTTTDTPARDSRRVRGLQGFHHKCPGPVRCRGPRQSEVGDAIHVALLIAVDEIAQRPIGSVCVIGQPVPASGARAEFPNSVGAHLFMHPRPGLSRTHGVDQLK
ncbi:hypothetical protein STENM327S_09084 [Streptomyces tendae]